MIRLVVTVLTALLLPPALCAGAALKKGLILVKDARHALILSHAVDRLRAYGPMRFDLAGPEDPRIERKLYDMTVLLGVASEDAELRRAWAGVPPKQDEAWALTTLSRDPLVVAATGNRPRAVLYAAWRLADLLRMEADVSRLNESHSPRVNRRYAAICGTAFGGPLDRQAHYMDTLRELPRYGLNGVMVVPGDWRVALGPGRVSPPVGIDAHGKIRIDPEAKKSWTTFLGVVNSYDSEIMLTAEPFVPPDYGPEAAEAFYRSGKEPEGYLAAVRIFYREFVEKLLDALPETDIICLTPGVEGAQYGGPYAKAPRIFVEENDPATSAKVMRVYLDVVTGVAGRRGKKVAFWPHSWGITSEGIRRMRELLFEYPGTIILEEDYWPNNLWQAGGTQLPILKFLPADIREKIDARNPLGMLSITDAEYYGGGALPNAFAEPYLFTVREVLRRHGSLLAFRLNLHDRTPFGTLGSVAEIQVLQASNAVWTNPRAPEDVWREWIERKYGKDAAEQVSSALRHSGTIVRDGFTLDGLNMFLHSTIEAGVWQPGGYVYRMFGRPDRLLITKTSNSVITSEEQFAYQLQLKAMPMEVFRKRQKRAENAVRDGLDNLSRARASLSPPDYAYLTGLFENAGLCLRVFQRLGELAHAANLMEDNYAGIDDPRGAFRRALSAVEALTKDPQLDRLDYAHTRPVSRPDNGTPGPPHVRWEMQKVVRAYQSRFQF